MSQPWPKREEEVQAQKISRDFARNLPREIKSQPIGQAMVLDAEERQHKQVDDDSQNWEEYLAWFGNEEGFSKSADADLAAAVQDMVAASGDLQKELKTYDDSKLSSRSSRSMIRGKGNPLEGSTVEVGKIKDGYQKMCKELDRYSSVFKFVPSGDRYISLLTGTIETIVQATVAHCKIGDGFEAAIDRMRIELRYCSEVLYVARSYPSADQNKLKSIVVRVLSLCFRFLTPYTRWCASRFERFKGSLDKDFYARNVEEPLKELLDASRDLERANDLLDTRKLNILDSKVDVMSGQMSSFFDKMNKRTEQQLYSVEQNITTKLEMLRAEVGKKANEQTKLSAEVMLQLENKDRKHRAVWHWRDAVWKSSRKPPEACQQGTTRTVRSWKEVEAASHFLEAVAENGYPIDAKELKDIQVAPRVFAPLQEWLTAEDSRWLWLRGPVYCGHLSDVSVAAAHTVMIAERIQVPVVAYRFRPDEAGLAESVDSTGDNRSGAMNQFVLMVFSIIRQLIWLLPEEVNAKADLGRARFHRLDGSTASLLDAFNLLEALIDLAPKLLIFVLDGFEFVDNDNEVDVDCTEGYLDLFLSILRAAGQKRNLKVLISSDGLCRTLVDDDNLDVDEQVHVDDDEAGGEHLSGLWDVLAESSSEEI